MGSAVAVTSAVVSVAVVMVACCSSAWSLVGMRWARLTP